MSKSLMTFTLPIFKALTESNLSAYEDLYNLACCKIAMGELSESAELLEKAQSE